MPALRQRLPQLVLIAIATLFLVCDASLRAAEPQKFDEQSLEFFEKKVRPILVERCFECHSGKSKKIQGALRLDSRAAALAGGDTGPAVEPGNLDESLLIDAINYGDIYQMPPKSKMPDEEIATLTKWVEMGAPWPHEENAGGAGPAEIFDLAARRQAHWAWQNLQHPQPPPVRQAGWPLDSLDHFILAKLEANKLAPAPPAEKRVWLRRVTYDLIGLPPTPEETAAFLADESPQAIEKVVDRLLASPHLGERWARHWMDLVRYAESRGHEFDPDVPNPYHYRDYLIRAFNADVPYDQFLKEHLAGDLLPQPRLHPQEGFNESILGTGFWFLGEWIHSPVDIRQDEADRFDNMLDVASKTFLGLTVACARCHDHKFDAISQADYYALAGYLQSSAYRQARFDSLPNNEKVLAELESLRQEYRLRFAAAALGEVTKNIGSTKKYLLAARDAIQTNDAAKTAEIAAKHQVNSDLLNRWVEQIKAAAGDANHPLHAWALVSHASPEKLAEENGLAEVIAATRNHLSDISQKQAAALGDLEVIVDYGKADQGDFISDGVTFGAGPQPAGSILLPDVASPPAVSTQGMVRRDPAFLKLRLAGGTARDSGNLNKWDRAGRSIATPNFTVAQGTIHFLVKGVGHVFAVVDSHRMVQGPLHGVVLRDINTGDNLRWEGINLKDYQGHNIRLEFIAEGEHTLEIHKVVQGNRRPGDVSHPAQPQLESILVQAKSVEPLAEALGSYLGEAAKQLAADTLRKTPQPEERAKAANWILQNVSLWRTQNPADLKPLTEEYLAKYNAIAAKVKIESRTAPAMWDGDNVNEQLLIRGNSRTPGDEVPRRLLTGIEVKQRTIPRGSGRLQLAEEILDPANPFASRVIVNRIWQHLMGRGIVPSVDNFGVLGQPPTHPELLDHLAVQFMEQGWSMKSLMKRIVLSQTYRMSSRPKPQAEEADPMNLLWHRMEIRRLEGEAIRDGMLAISGRLDRTQFGPPVPVHLTPFMDGRGRPGGGPLDGAGRRSIYISVRRNFLSPMMLAFDTPIPFSTVGQRNVSNVPAQALILMNDPLVVQQAQLWAKRELATGGAPEEHIERLYLSAFARRPDAMEMEQALGFLDAQGKELGIPPENARKDERPWADLCHVLFNLKEFTYLQ